MKLGRRAFGSSARTDASVRIAAGGVALLMAYTVATWLVPELRIQWYSPPSRVLLETAGLCVALFAAMAVLMPDGGDEAEVPRNAIVASLLALGVSNAIFRVGPLLVGAPAFGGLYRFYPWLAARYLVGGLFIAAALGRPRAPLRWYLACVAAVLVVADVLFTVLRDQLPLPRVQLEYTARGLLIPVSAPLQALLVAVVPAALFGIGAWLAWRTHRRGAVRLYLWVSVALAVQALSLLHEVFYATTLGAVVTSADLLRVLFLVLLLTGALLKVRQVVIDRGAAVAALDADLRAREELLRALGEFADLEQNFRTLVVHELATPIATLRTFAHVLVDGHSSSLTSGQRRAAQGLESESRRLQQLVDRMEELRSLELDDFACDLRSVRLQPLIDDAVSYTRALPGSHPVTVTWGCENVLVRADAVRLGQALRDVLTNATRYSPDGSPIFIECRRASPGCVEVLVIDRGKGIPAEDRERMLRRFERGSSAEGKPGTGLGLYVASRVLAAHGSQLVIEEPEDGVGTRVVLELREAQ